MREFQETFAAAEAAATVDRVQPVRDRSPNGATQQAQQDTMLTPR